MFDVVQYSNFKPLHPLIADSLSTSIVAVMREDGSTAIAVESDDVPAALALAMNADEEGRVSYDSIKKLETFLIAYGDQSPPPTVHRFLPGLYFRQITMPANSIIVSRLHAQDNFAVISQGSATVWDETGTKVIKAPHSRITRAGTKRVLFIHEEMIWTTVHSTQATTLEEVERQIFRDGNDELLFRQTLLENTSCQAG